jgi:hypothetical protein
MPVHDCPLFEETCHRTLGIGVPEAEAANCAVAPAVTVMLPGCKVITGEEFPLGRKFRCETVDTTVVDRIAWVLAEKVLPSLLGFVSVNCAGFVFAEPAAF